MYSNIAISLMKNFIKIVWQIILKHVEQCLIIAKIYFIITKTGLQMA